VGCSAASAFDADYNTAISAINVALAAEGYTFRRAYLGDIDGNGVVSFADYQVLEANYNHTGVGWAQGDFDGDNRVGFSDYQLLEAQYGHQIPEPVILALILVGTAVVLMRRRAA
jgi:hypothetical protein